MRTALKMVLATALGAVAVALSSCSSIDSEVGSGNSSGDKYLYANIGVKDNGFVEPAAPARSAMPSSRSGKDKHGMPYYTQSQRNRIVRTTAYTHSESDHVTYGRKNAIGTQLKYGKFVRSAAADWSVYPLGTKFRVKGQPYLYVVDDYGSALVGTGTIDIYQPSRGLMNMWGRRYVEITVVQWGSFQQSSEILSQRSRWSHCRAMNTQIARKTGKSSNVAQSGGSAGRNRS